MLALIHAGPLPQHQIHNDEAANYVTNNITTLLSNMSIEFS